MKTPARLTGKEKNRCRVGWFCALIPHVLRRF